MSTYKVHVRVQEYINEHHPGLSLRKLADEMNANREALRVLANNQTKHLSKELIADLCAYFNCTPGDLIVLIKEDEDRYGENKERKSNEKKETGSHT